VVQRVHQSGSLADLARILERLLGVLQGSLGIAKKPQGPRPIGPDCYPDVLAKSRGQRTMLGSSVMRKRLIKVRSSCRDVTRAQQRHGVECDIARDPEPVEDGEQHQRVFGMFSKRLRPLYIIGTQIHGRRFQRGLSAPNDPMPPLPTTATNGLIKP